MAAPAEFLSADPVASAEAAGLRYVEPNGPCIRRVRCGTGFRYVGVDGKTTVKDQATLARIRALVIPPAWENVWICPVKDGHIQAVGWDAKGRKQYRYHAQYRQVRDEAKFGRMIAFSAALARIRARVEQDLALPGLPRDKVVAAVVRLLETTFIRVGNDEYARENESFGLTTMRDRHVRFAGHTLQFEFKGKSGQRHSIELTDRRLAKIVKQCQDLPGYELFQYVDESSGRCRVESADVNRYLREITGQDFTAKDFRTWAGTILAARELSAAEVCTSETQGKRTIVAAVKNVALSLGNRPATCRKYYVHPAILEAYSDGALREAMQRGEEAEREWEGYGLRREEYCVLVLIARYQSRLAKQAKQTLAA